MFISISAIAQDPRKFKWFVYKDKKIVLDSTVGNDIYELEFNQGDIYGLFQTKKGTYLAEPQEFDKRKPFNPVLLTEHSAKRLVANSDGYHGKVGNIQVSSGDGGRSAVEEEKKAGKATGLHHIKVNSSMLSRAMYSLPKKELYLVFSNGSTWVYKKVTPKEIEAFERAESQGKFFNDFIKDEKDGTRLDSL